jgi:two-component system, cell cycle sensor histidine kinase and response regulator CckA
LALLLLSAFLAMPASAQSRLEKIRVVMEINYPPFVFEDNAGYPQGSQIDLWRLWEKKTGIKTEITLMEWSEAQRRLQAGDFDVIDKIAKTEGRSILYDFSKPFATIEVPAFFLKDISGITNAASLKGFAVGVQTGDSAIEFLHNSGVENVLRFNNYEEIVLAAKEHKVNVMVMDKAPALYFLHKHDMLDNFRQSAPLTTISLHRAVKKGNSELLATVEDGFRLITPEELKKIETKWYGASLGNNFPTTPILTGAGVLCLLVLALYVWNRVLRKAVNARTTDLKSSEERYRGILEQAVDGILLGSPEWIITGANSRMEQLTGRSRDELIGQHVSTIFPPEILETVPLRFDLLQQGQTVTSQRVFVRPDGSRIYVEMGSKMMPDGTYQSVYHDITERKKAEEALRESEDQLTQIIELSPISMALVCMDGTIERINRRAIETFGYFLDDIPDMDRWWELAYPDENYRAEVIAQWMDLVGKAMAEKREIERREYRVTCKDGTVKTVLIFGVQVSNKIFVMFDDITDRKNVEEDRLNLERQLLHAQKLESLGILSGGIAHDFNNLLLAILGNLDLALIRLPQDTPVRKNIDQAVKAGRHAAQLTNMMLAYSGKALFVIKPLNLTELVDENATMLEAAIPKSITLVQHLDNTVPVIKADAGQLQQVIMNLITNAAEAIGDQGGKIRISTGAKRFDQAILNSSRLDEKSTAGVYVWLEVCDNGCGMDGDTLNKLFDPFFTTKFTGRGLGMSAVLGIIRAHKGALLVESRPDVGTTIQVLFPIADDQPAGTDSLNAGESVQEKQARSSVTVLLVDDEDIIRNVSTAMLVELGFETVAAASGEEALALFQIKGDSIGVVLLDQVMPGMDGVSVFKELRRIRPDIKVLLATGFSQQEVSERFRGLGLNGFLQKPYNLKNLASELARVLDGADR